MKKIILASLFLIAAFFSNAQNAYNFTANDCTGTSHDLFTELDSGKTIIMVFVMPCGACVGSSVNAAAVVSSMSNPDVLFYVFDDAGNTSCSSLSSWESTNSVTPTATFDNAGNANPQSNYGSGGMPKVVIVGGGSAHKIYLAQNGSVSQSAMQNAINNSISEINAVPEVENQIADLNVYPNPSNENELFIAASHLNSVSEIMIYSMDGRLVKQKNISATNSAISIDVSELQKGEYLIALQTKNGIIHSKFVK